MKAQDFIDEIEKEERNNEFYKSKSFKINRSLRYFLWTIFGLILMAGLVLGTTIIRDSGSSTFTSNLSLDGVEIQNASGIFLNNISSNSKDWIALVNNTIVKDGKIFSLEATDGDWLNLTQNSFEGELISSNNLRIGSHQSGNTVVFMQSPARTTMRIYNSSGSEYMSLYHDGTNAKIDSTKGNVSIGTLLSSDFHTTGITIGVGLSQLIAFDGDHMESNGFIGLCPNMSNLHGTIEGCMNLQTNDSTLFLSTSNGAKEIEFIDGVLQKVRFSAMMQLNANTSAITCNSANQGIIYYDGEVKKHYGCNASGWQSLY